MSDTDALRLLIKNGARIRGVQKLHAKLYLFGNNQAVVTSANLTDAALLHNHEFGFVTDEANVIERCHEYFDMLWKQAGPDLNIVTLDEWDAKLTAAKIGRSTAKKGQQWPDYGAKCGFAEAGSLVFVQPMFSEAPKAFVKFFGESHNRLLRDVTVLDEVERSGCHWACSYPKRPRQVEDGSIMFMARLCKSPADTLIFGRAVGVRHVDGRDDATPKDIERRPWKVNWPHYVRVHHPEFVAGTLANGISLAQLMRELGPKSFEPTKRNLIAKNGKKY